MADKNSLIEQMLEHLVNDEQEKAEELFHEYVVSKSREIYEGLIESEIDESDESSEEEEEDETDVEESEEFLDDELSLEADDAEDSMDLDSKDPTDDLAASLDKEDGEDLEDKSEEELFQDLDDIVDQLEAKFAEIKGDMGMGGEEEMKDDFDLETVREYVEKVPAGHGAEKKGAAEKADNTRSTVDNMKNDMGGTTANLRGGEAKEASRGTAGGLANNKPQDMNTGNINVPGGKAGKTGFTHKEPGHGAEKKGSAEGKTDGQSLFRGRR